MSSGVDCRDVIDEEIIATANPIVAEHYAAGITMCMDPKDSQWSLFEDGIGDGTQTTKFIFLTCKEEDPNAIDC